MKFRGTHDAMKWHINVPQHADCGSLPIQQRKQLRNLPKSELFTINFLGYCEKDFKIYYFVF
jgi:hypothetical protein